MQNVPLPLFLSLSGSFSLPLNYSAGKVSPPPSCFLSLIGFHETGIAHLTGFGVFICLLYQSQTCSPTSPAGQVLQREPKRRLLPAAGEGRRSHGGLLLRPHHLPHGRPHRRQAQRRWQRPQQADGVRLCRRPHGRPEGGAAGDHGRPGLQK